MGRIPVSSIGLVVLDQIYRMKPEERYAAVEEVIARQIVRTGSDRPEMEVTYRAHRGGTARTDRMRVVGVSGSDNWTSGGFLVTQSPDSRTRLFSISLANVVSLGVVP